MQPAGMIAIPGGRFSMGEEGFYPEEAPVRQVQVDDFLIDATPVTNRQFAAFVAATGHRTLAEIAPDPNDYPGMPPEMAKAGSLLFSRPSHVPDMRDYRYWWSFCFGADWRHPLGPGSSLDGLEDHPVVHIAYADALAYADWLGKALPTEAEWEYAARGGVDGAAYAWGSELAPGGAMLANYWQGAFPVENTLADGWERTSPVGAYPVNGYGLSDMIGNVWEWTQDWYADAAKKGASASDCCIPRNPRGGKEQESYDPCTPDIAIGRKVLKGGSHLCAENYCQRYRPAARYAQPIDTSTCHVGFRCVVRPSSAL
ncbi:formylglycine-generating enzyme family protein [Sphingobium sp. LB126]|uniref:formylglycine-generating enzyme family protein n=1 Tax=Sphingobium sp. LB126 TaxID=1983755 RepID=UPI001F5B8738|nr:formylglycine-generating enzyme family protein [Sphingobium sp. LB126]